MMNVRFVLLAMVVLSTGCTWYRGDGEFSRMSRTYIPVIAVSRGYMIEMPDFKPDKDQTFSYSLAGMPRKNKSFTLEMVIYWPSNRMSPDQQKAMDFSVPDAHMVQASLVDKRSGKVIDEITSKVNDLPITDIGDFNHSPFIRRLLDINFNDVPENADLEFIVNYLIKGEPLNHKMTIFLYNEPPFG